MTFGAPRIEPGWSSNATASGKHAPLDLAQRFCPEVEYSETSRAIRTPTKRVPVVASSTASIRAVSAAGVMSPYPTVVTLMKLKQVAVNPVIVAVVPGAVLRI